MLLKKIGPKQILGNVKDFVMKNCPSDGDMVKAYTLIGRAAGVQTGTTNHGEWVAFVGDFEATVLTTGETFRSGKAFTHEPLTQMLMSSLAENDMIEFALLVLVKRDDSMPVGYEYFVEPMVEVQQSDSLQHLRDLAENKTKALEAPAEHAKAEAAPEKTPAKRATKKA